jgi:hypothetical protein
MYSEASLHCELPQRGYRLGRCPILISDALSGGRQGTQISRGSIAARRAAMGPDCIRAIAFHSRVRRINDAGAAPRVPGIVPLDSRDARSRCHTSSQGRTWWSTYLDVMQRARLSARPGRCTAFLPSARGTRRANILTSSSSNVVLAREEKRAQGAAPISIAGSERPVVRQRKSYYSKGGIG